MDIKLVKQLQKLNEDFADTWKVGDYIDQLGKIVKITPTVIKFLNDNGQTSTMGRKTFPVGFWKSTPKVSKGKLTNVNMDQLYKTGDIGNATVESKKVNEEDLFPNASPEDVAGRKVEVDKRKAEEKRQKEERRKVARVDVEKMCEEDDVPLFLLKELHEENLGPNHRIRFTSEQWKQILVNAEADNPGVLTRMYDLERYVQGAVMALDEATPTEFYQKTPRR